MNLSQVTKEILKKRTYGSYYKTDMADENSFLYFNFLSFLVQANFLKLQILAVTSGSYLNKSFWVFREKDKLLNVQYTLFYQGIKILVAVFYNEILLSQLYYLKIQLFIMISSLQGILLYKLSLIFMHLAHITLLILLLLLLPWIHSVNR